MVIMNIICAVLWGICAALNFMAGNIFLGVLDIILTILWGIQAGMRMKD